ncbi:Maf family protein [Paracoccus pacificus]|uniref:dTTP/UTP pyrophosphatase n=1 Tax=Paracoccus pacificus TaxID=1463598 RepID=A0ABW4RAU6_9RHOB
MVTSVAPKDVTRLPLILGSASPRRLELLRQIGIAPDEVRAADIDEAPRPQEMPRDYAQRIAGEKLSAILAASPPNRGIVLCADTVVYAGRRILGKSADVAEARRFLRLLSGRRHKVATAVAVASPTHRIARLVETTVRFRPLTDAEIDGYIGTDEWRGKAGGYAIQGAAAAFIPWIQGSFSAVVGLPLAETMTMLRAAGWKERTGT